MRDSVGQWVVWGLGVRLKVVGSPGMKGVKGVEKSRHSRESGM